MSTTPGSPLTAAHLDQIRNALDVINVAKQQIALAERAGIDVAAQKAQLADSESKLLQLKNVYFPGQ
jgi:hypothetical protein